LPVTRTPQTHDAPRKGAPITHDYPLQIIRRAWHWLRVSPGKIIAAQTKSALHRTRLRVLHHKNFQFYFSTNRYARAHRCWLSAGVRQLKALKKISVFFSFKDLE